MTGTNFRRGLVIAGVLVAAGLWGGGAFAQTNYAQPPSIDDAVPVQGASVQPDIFRNVSLDQKLGDSIPLDLTFRDEHGQPVVLRSFFGSKPVILTLVYYSCPMLCTQVLNAVTRSVKLISLNMGDDYEIVTLSIDPTERPVLAEAKHAVYSGMYERPGAVKGWHFLTGDEEDIKKLAAAVGFRYAYDPASKQFAHPSGIMVLTPDGKLARYFYGINYPSRDLRLGLVEASQGKIGTPVDQILLYCYHYDPATGKYGLLIAHVIQIAGGLTVLALGGLVLFLFRFERRKMPPPAVKWSERHV
ncbi:MAG TPA: SCO family protein [Candidatus Acidoferrum sp.]|nr:SCO family protein [Candidatus Acidoferrum sp.]